MPFCTSCGHENLGTAHFCNGCGQQMPAPVPAPHEPPIFEQRQPLPSTPPRPVTPPPTVVEQREQQQSPPPQIIYEQVQEQQQVPPPSSSGVLRQTPVYVEPRTQPYHAHRRKSTAILLAWLFWPAYDFYLGNPVKGVVKLLTFGGFGVWALVDALKIVFMSQQEFDILHNS